MKSKPSDSLPADDPLRGAAAGQGKGEEDAAPVEPAVETRPAESSMPLVDKPPMSGDQPGREDADTLGDAAEGLDHSDESELSPHQELPDNYRVERVLGAGGMGMVYLAEQIRPVRRPVAIKLIKLGMDSQEVLARFRAEQQALAIMNHPSIAGEYEAGTTSSGAPYFVMEYVSGEPITDYCDRERLDLAERIALFMQVCGAIQHAHQRGIIHRDIKPSNVLVTTLDGKAIPKIIDFGIAKALSEDLADKSLSTQHGVIVGTPEYMSPEQADFSSLDIDIRTDIYSLGVLLYELCVGALPFSSSELLSGGLLEMHHTILEKEPPKPSLRLRGFSVAELQTRAEKRRIEGRSLLRRVTGDLDWIILKCLEKDRERRYGAAAELGADLQRHLGHEPVLAGPPSVLYRLQKFGRKHRYPVTAAALLVVALLCALGVSAQRDRERFRGQLRLLGEAIAAEDLRAASSTLALLKGDYPDREEVKEATRDVAKLEHELMVRVSQEHQKRAGDHALQLRQNRESKESLEAVWKDATQELDLWQPVWERSKELDAWHRLESIDEDISESYNKTLFSLLRAIEEAPAESEQAYAVQAELERLYFDSYKQAWVQGSISLPPSYFKGLVDSLGLGNYEEPLSETVSFQSDPPGAEVYCFRYEVREERLMPIPFAAARGLEEAGAGLLPELPLVVEKVWQPLSPFQNGDHLLRLNETDVKSHGDFARVLADVKSDQTVPALVLRDGEQEQLSWVPFPRSMYVALDSAPDLRPGRVVDIYAQFGFTFAAYPLSFQPQARVGTTGKDPVHVKLPKGSYLFVLRRDGYADARVPVAISSRQRDFRVRLLLADEIPPNFVYVPSSMVPCGGDDDSYHGLPAAQEHVGGFFLARTETTVREYLEFLNSPEVLARTDENGMTSPQVDWTAPVYRQFLTNVLVAERRVRIVPVYRGQLFFKREAGRWTSGTDPDWPVFGLPVLAGFEYAHWMTQRHRGRWRFRLPYDLEWEKTARGADRRLFVWGDYLLFSFVRSQQGSCPSRPALTVDVVGVQPFDESVYGVRDLGGSMKEPVLQRDEESRMAIIRGGEWLTIDHRDFRVATRNRRYVEQAVNFVGLRLAAELPEGADGDP